MAFHQVLPESREKVVMIETGCVLYEVEEIGEHRAVLQQMQLTLVFM